MERMAVWTGGRLEAVSRPAMVVAELRRLDLVGMAEVSVVNQTTGQAARALRVFPDGTFDAFVELAAGRNQLRFAARGRDGRVHQVDRWVTYREPAAPAAVSAGPPGAEDPAEDSLVQELRRRTAEIQALAELEKSRERQRKEVDVQVEESGRTGSGAR
jgi:hypothetical protein